MIAAAASKIKISLAVQGYFCNRWPELRIIVNDQCCFHDAIRGDQHLDFWVDCGPHNLLRLEHRGKRFGEDGVYDCSPDGTQDCFLEIKDILFDDVTIGEKLKGELVFRTLWNDLQLQNNDPAFTERYSIIADSNGRMSFNGHIDLEFETPVYNWLIINKYKVPLAQDMAYFSNYSTRWNYEEDLALLQRIEDLMGFDENCHNQRSETGTT